MRKALWRSTSRRLMLRLPIIYGSVRDGRVGIRVAQYLVSALGERGFDPVLVDPAELDIPMLEKRFREYDEGSAPPDLKKLAQLFEQADALLIVSAEYNHLPPPALINLLNYYRAEFSWRPAGIATYSGGAMAGVRAGSHLRDMLSELSLVSIPMALAYPSIQDKFDENGTRAEGADGPDKVLDTFAEQLRWYAEALKAKREQGVPGG